MSANPSNDDRDLDQLLGMAQWPAPGPEQVSRLRAKWRSLRAARVRYRRGQAAMLAAAAVLLVAIGWIASRQRNERDGQLAVHRQPDPAINSPAVGATRAADSGSTIAKLRAHDAGQTLLVQSPTLYERVVLSETMPLTKKHAATTAHKRRGRQTTMARAQSGPSVRWDNPLAAGILVTARRAGETAGGLIAQQNRWRASVSRTTVEFVAGTAVSIERAVRLARNASPHGRAIEDVVARGSVSDIANVLVREPEPDFRRRLLVELLTRGTTESVDSYLGFVANPVSRSEALAALAAAPRVPSDVLLDYLRSPRVPQRYAAALALGRISHAAVIDALGASLADAGSRQQALVALLINPNARAAEIIDRAREDLYLVASVRAAELDLHRLTDTPTR